MGVFNLINRLVARMIEMNDLEAAEYWDGVSDCQEGLKQASNNADYLRGYGDQYALEQQLTEKGEKHDS